MYNALVLVNWETGANPVRTRHRNERVDAAISLGKREILSWEDGRCDGL